MPAVWRCREASPKADPSDGTNPALTRPWAALARRPVVDRLPALGEPVRVRPRLVSHGRMPCVVGVGEVRLAVPEDARALGDLHVACWREA